MTALVVAGACLLATRGANPAEVPPIGRSLATVPLHGNDWTLPGGGVVTDGFEVLELAPGQSPVTITSVRLIGARDVRLVGARVAGPHREVYQFAGDRGFPSVDGKRSRPAVGTTIAEAKRGWGLLVGLRVGSSGYPMIVGVEVRYSVDRGVNHQVYRQVFRGGVIFCADRPPSNRGRCRPPNDLEKLVGNGGEQ
ncbi:MAG TPA: hypothetical protein VHW64_07750 [Nocardioides sp.]|uniref:hypothetical protein n=1 Tax=Nocardioides sp. TaxID=35761 RepID=UPI002E300C01|nr:hypothetical protein [Nocardioides sp.]HEX3930581.1 hypothetical protein [Nocardioides sp.]